MVSWLCHNLLISWFGDRGIHYFMSSLSIYGISWGFGYH